MAMPSGLPIIDTMIGFPQKDFSQYDFIRRQTKDRGSREEMQFPVEYMFKQVPKDLPADDPIGVTLREMDRFGVAQGLIGVGDEVSRTALKRHPDRFIPSGNVDDPNDVMGSVQALRRDYEMYGIRAVGAFPAGTFPQVAIDDPKMYPIYATCVELDIPIFVCAGIPGPRLKFAPQEVARIDTVMYDFPDLVFVTRHGCEPWERLAMKLMLKWPNLYYSTSRSRPSTTPRRSSSTPTPAAPTRSSTRATSRWASPSSGSSPTCPTCPSRTRCGPSSCTRTAGVSSNWTSRAGRTCQSR